MAINAPGAMAWTAGGLYLTGEDSLRITTIGALAGGVVTLEGRLVTPDGCVVPIAERHVPNSNYTAASQIFPVAEGVLVNAQLRVTTGTAVRGHVFAFLEIVRGGGSAAQPLGTLLQGYLTSGARLAWPGSLIESSTAGVGRLRSITGTDPAAGAEISETVPAGVRWRFISLTANFVTSAVVATRVVRFLFDDGTNTQFRANGSAGQGASNAFQYSLVSGGSVPGTPSVDILVPAPSAMLLTAGSRIRTSTQAIDVGDNWGPPQYLVEEFIEG